MRVNVVYKDLSDEQISKLLEDDNVENVTYTEDDVIENWVRENNLDGMAISYAYDKFMRDCDINIGKIKFSRIILSTNKYINKNIRIGDSVQRCFVRK